MSEIGQFCVSPKISVLEGIETLDQLGHKVLFVCEEGRLCGVVSDGDIRRYILKNGDLKAPLSQMMYSAPRTVSPGDRAGARALMQQYFLLAVPAVDGDGQIREIYFYNENDPSQGPIREQIDTPVVIMAGGKGSRLAPYTDVLPKPLLPIAGKTMLERILDAFGAFGCGRFFLTVNYKKGLIRAYLEEAGLLSGVELLEEGDFLGTAGSLSLLTGRLNEPFFVSNCDILLDVDFSSILRRHREEHNALTMVTSLKSWQVPYGVSITDDSGRLLEIQEKPSMSFLVNTGVYVLEPDILALIPEGEVFHMTDLVAACIKAGRRVGTYPIRAGQWQDMGEPESMQRMLSALTKEPQ